MRLKKNVRMTLLYLAFVVIGVVMVFPFIWMIATSFKTGTDIYSLSLLPKKFTLDNYREVLAGSDFPRWFLNSFLVAGITTLSVLVLTLFWDMLSANTVSAEKKPFSPCFFPP